MDKKYKIIEIDTPYSKITLDHCVQFTVQIGYAVAKSRAYTLREIGITEGDLKFYKSWDRLDEDLLDEKLEEWIYNHAITKGYTRLVEEVEDDA
jgi:hypothetical protein